MSLFQNSAFGSLTGPGSSAAGPGGSVTDWPSSPNDWECAPNGLGGPPNASGSAPSLSGSAPSVTGSPEWRGEVSKRLGIVSGWLAGVLNRAESIKKGRGSRKCGRLRHSAAGLFQNGPGFGTGPDIKDAGKFLRTPFGACPALLTTFLWGSIMFGGDRHD
jgi:hypothetical protein